MTNAIKLLSKGAQYGALAYLTLLLLVYFFQERLIFFPDSVEPSYRYSFRGRFAEHYIDVEGAKLHALWFHADQSKGIIVYFHGNGGNNRDWGSVGEDLVPHGYDVLIADYRGYGKSTGKIESQTQLLTDAEAVYRYARASFADERIVLYGRSLGSGMAVELASRHRVKRLLLETPYASLAGVARQTYPIIPVFLLKYPFPSDIWATDVKCPVVIFHGTADEVVPFASGEALSRRFPAPVRFVRVEGAHHNNLLGYREYWDALAEALK